MSTIDRIAKEMACTCLMSHSREMSRIVTSMYEDVLRPFGIKGSQLNLLAAVAYAGTVRRTELGKALHLDSSTLTRNLRVMETNGWIEDAEGADGRGAPVRVTAEGEALLVQANPAWKSAQRRAAKLLGDDGREALTRLVGPRSGG